MQGLIPAESPGKTVGMGIQMVTVVCPSTCLCRSSRWRSSGPRRRLWSTTPCLSICLPSTNASSSSVYVVRISPLKLPSSHRAKNTSHSSSSSGRCLRVSLSVCLFLCIFLSASLSVGYASLSSSPPLLTVSLSVYLSACINHGVDENTYFLDWY